MEARDHDRPRVIRYPLSEGRPSWLDSPSAPATLGVSPESDAVGMWANAAALGALSSLVFWLIWRSLRRTFIVGGESKTSRSLTAL